MSTSQIRSAVLLLAGLATVMILWRVGAPAWALLFVAFVQAAVVGALSLDLLQTRSSRVGVALLVFFLVGLVVLPWLAIATSHLEDDPVWRIPPPATELPGDEE